MRRFEVRKHQNSSPKTNESAVAVLNKSKQKYKHLNDVIAKPSKQDPETIKRESNPALHGGDDEEAPAHDGGSRGGGDRNPAGGSDDRDPCQG